MRSFLLISLFIMVVDCHQYTKLPLNSYSVPLGSVGPLPKVSPPPPPNNSETVFTSQDGFSSNLQELDKTTWSNSNGTVPSPSDSENVSSSSQELLSKTDEDASSINDGVLDRNIIQKNIYVHLPAPDLEQQDTEVHAPIPQTHYKIIFIRPPTVSSVPVIPPVPQYDQRTIVYVLTGKEKEQEDFEVSLEPFEPSTPEVHFIKYDTQSDQSRGASGIIDDNGSKISEEFGNPLT